MFHVDGVTVRFDERTVLDQIGFKVRPRRVTVIAGPSGSGKTTLVRLCNRLELPTSRRVLFCGADKGITVLWVSHDRDQANRIGDAHIVLIDGRLASPEQATGYLDPR